MNTKHLYILLALWLSSYVAMAQAPAFPGAEGFGRYTTGGRGGRVIHVTNLNDSGEGSLRNALNASGKRIIVFDVGGTIELLSELKIGKGDVTVMGQTAPGDGICLSGFNLTTAADNIIIRFIRVRPGDKTEASDGKDAMGGRFKKNIIIDHCSCSWSTDEACSFYVNQNFTLQWCFVTESLRESGHSKGAHGYGGIWGGESASFHHNLMAHHDSRNPRFSGSGQTYRVNLPVESEIVDMRNCVFYNWGGKVGYGAEGGSYNIVNNYYKPGPGSRLLSGEFMAMDKDAGNSGNEANAHGVFYIKGNHYVGKGDNWDWNGIRNNTLDPVGKCKSDTLYPYGEVTTHSAQQAYEQVLSYGGCSLKRDVVDNRIVEEARTGTATYTGSKSGKQGIIDTPSDVGGWPVYQGGARQVDSDNDGMPDTWETANGLNPHDASDATQYTIDSRGWYTNVEVYCNWLVEGIMKAGNQQAETPFNDYYPDVTAPEDTPTETPTDTPTSADRVTLAAWDFSTHVKYTPSDSNGNKTYYTPSVADKVNMEYTFSAQQPFFYPTSGSITSGTLTIESTDGNKKWYISDFNNGALRMYTASPQPIVNPTDAAQHYNYAEVELSAAGYKSLQFSCRMSGNNSKTLPVYILVSTDGGATWMVSSETGSTGSSWSNFNDIAANLAVDNQQSVKVRALIGYDAGATGDMYLNSFKVTGIPLGSETVCSLTTAVTPQGAGYVAMSPVGNAAVKGTGIAYTAKNMSGYTIREWQDADGETLAATPTYTTTVSGNTAVTAVFGDVDTYTLTVNKTGEGAQWGEVTLSPEPVNGKYDAGTEVTLTVIPNPVTNFLMWETGSAELTRQVTVDGNMEVTASFDVIPFIVAWDFDNEKNTSRGNRPADYAFATDNTGVMLFYQGASHASTNWGSGKVSFGGKELWAARRYTDYSKEEQIPRAFVASFSVKDYDKINIHSLVAVNNNCVRKRQLLQMSTTSSTEGFTTLKTLEMVESPSSKWQDMDYELNTNDIDGMVYIRWIEDETSDFFDGGNHSGTEGFYLADVIIFADQTVVDDAEAPQLISSSPSEGSTGVSARGNIVLSFNERVKQGAGDVTLNGETLSGSFGSKSVTYPYHGLSYGTQYTLSIAEGAITDLSGNAFPARDITFTVMERPQPVAKVFDAVVAQDGTGDYTTVQAAIDAVPASRISPWLIFVKNGEYEELVTIPQNKPFVHLIGQDKEKTIIKYLINNGSSSDLGYEYSTNNPASKTYGKQAMVQVNATDFYTENITYLNRWGVEQQSGPQANAMSSRADRQAFYNCKFRSYQDTWYTDIHNSGDRQYVNNCLIEGAVDFYYGGGDNYIENSTFRLARTGSVIVAPGHQAGTKWGYVMVNNTIDGKGGSNKLGRAWQNQPIAVWINTTLKTTLAAEGWSEWHIAPKLFAEYNTMDANGQPVDLNNRRTSYKVDADRLAAGETSPVTRQAVLSAEEAAKYTYEAVTAGNDDWNPRKFFEPVQAPSELKADEVSMSLTWASSPYAICYIVIDSEEQVIGITKKTSFQTDGKSHTYTVRAVNEYGSLSEPSTIDVTTGISVPNGQLPVINTQITDLQGRRLSHTCRGLNIVTERFADGSCRTHKVFIK